MPGVLAIITPDNAGKLSHPEKVPQAVGGPLLQNKDILFNGQHVAVVVAETLEQAQAAASRGAGDLHRRRGGHLDGCACSARPTRRSISATASVRRTPIAAIRTATFNSGAVKVDATYITPIEHHNPMEPHATIAAWNGDKLTVWTATQGISGAQATLAGQFGIDKADVRVICPYLGRRLRLEGQYLAAGDAGGDGGEDRQAAGEAGADPSADVHVERLPAADGAETEGGVGHQRHRWSRCGTTASARCRSRRLASSAEPVALATEMLYACPNVAVTHRLVGAERGAADLYAGAGRGVRHVRAGIGDGRIGGRAEDGSDRVPAAQLCRDGPAPEQAVRQQGAAGLLRARCQGVRLVATVDRSLGRCATAIC